MVYIFCQNGLYDDEVSVVVGSLYDAQVIDISIAIEVEVGESRIGIIEHLLEFLKIFRLTKKRCYCFQIKIL